MHHNAGPTAELALGPVLAAARALVPSDQAMRSGDWTPRFILRAPTMVLDGHPATVIGYGEVGRRVCRSLVALGMEVRAVRARADSLYAAGEVQVHPVRDLANLLSRARVVVLAVPANPATTGRLSEELIAGPEVRDLRLAQVESALLELSQT